MKSVDEDDFVYQPGDYLKDEEGQFWVVSERLYNFDAIHLERSEEFGEQDMMGEHDLRRYLLVFVSAQWSKQTRVREADILTNFEEVSEREIEEDLVSGVQLPDGVAPER